MPIPLLRQDRTLSLAERHEQLSRTSQAMWQLLKSKLDLRDADLRYALKQIEPLPPEPKVLDCRVCRHPVRSSARNCLYCGTVPHEQTQATRVVNISGAWL